MVMLSRYNRQEMLSFIGQAGQQKLLKSTVAVVGLGALGTVAAEILARSGVGRLFVIDRDVVELTDLQRQLLYDESDIGKPKATAAAEKLRRINSEIKVVAAAVDVDYKKIESLVGKPDAVLDCADNLETRFLINEYCLKNRLPWVHAAAIRDSAELMAFDFSKNSPRQLPCFACIFGKAAAEETCDTVGVLASATTAVAAMQATEAMKLLVGKEKEIVGGLLRLNVWSNSLANIAVKKNPNCGSCGSNSRYDYLAGKRGSKVVSLCGRNSYQIKGKPVDLVKLKLQLQRIGENVADFGECVSFRNLTVFKDGRALVKADSAEKAKAEYSRYVG